MKIFTFSFILKSDDFGDYLLDCDSQDSGNALVKTAGDYYGFDIEDTTIDITSGNDKGVYDALSTTRYPSLGYTSKDDLFSAYDDVIEDSDTTAYSIDGVEAAVIGVTEDHTRFVYDYDLIISTLMKNMGDESDETAAIEWYEYNIIRAFPYYQPSPIVLHCVGDN